MEEPTIQPMNNTNNNNIINNNSIITPKTKQPISYPSSPFVQASSVKPSVQTNIPSPTTSSLSSEERERETMSIPGMRDSEWKSIQDELGLYIKVILQPYEFPSTIPVVPSFNWKLESINSANYLDHCLEYLKKNFNLGQHYSYYNVSDRENFLYTSLPCLPFILQGGIHLVVCPQKTPIEELDTFIIFALNIIYDETDIKQQQQQQDQQEQQEQPSSFNNYNIENNNNSIKDKMVINRRAEVYSQLLASSIRSYVPVVHITTNLNDIWRFRWITDNNTIMVYEPANPSQSYELMKMRLRTHKDPPPSFLHPTLSKEYQFIHPKKLYLDSNRQQPHQLNNNNVTKFK